LRLSDYARWPRTDTKLNRFRQKSLRVAGSLRESTGKYPAVQRQERGLAIYRLEPIDPTDVAWEGAAFVEAVWTEAPDEATARSLVSTLTWPFTHNVWLSQRSRRWPWISAARCAVDPDHPAVTSGTLVTADGCTLGR
jgi:hypothetical protein